MPGRRGEREGAGARLRTLGVQGAVTRSHRVLTGRTHENVIALAWARQRRADEAILPNTAGRLYEGTGSNVFVGSNDP